MRFSPSTYSRITLFILIFSVFTQSCRKDTFSPTSIPDLSDGQMISKSNIDKFLSDKPSSQYLALDWRRARQSRNGKNKIVRVPVLNIDKISKYSGRAAKDIEGTNTNYYNSHPPEVFFIEGARSGIKSFLLNFVPNNSKKEFGNDGVWTGKLYEWDLLSDTIFVQEIAQSKLQKKYGLQLPNDYADKSLNSVMKSQRLQSLNGLKDKQVDLLSWLADLVADLVGWVGSLFGISTYYHDGDAYNGFGGGWRLNPISWEWLFGDGGTGVEDGGGGNYSYYYAGAVIYNDYVPGYNSGSGGSNYEPYPYGDSQGANVPSTYPHNNLITILGIRDYDTQQFLVNHQDIYVMLRGFLTTNGYSQDNLDFDRWAVIYLMTHPNMSAEMFRDQFLNPNYYNLDAPYNPVASNRYKLDDLTQLQYPRFAKLVNQLKTYLTANPKVINAIKEYTGYTREQVLDLATPGRGPKIMVTDDLTLYSSGKPDAQYYRYVRNPNYNGSNNKYLLDANGNTIKEDKILINKATVEAFEAGLLKLDPAVEKKVQGLAFMLAITIFHETVHYGRNWNNLGASNGRIEYGWAFEDMAFGIRVDSENVNEVRDYDFKLQ